MSKEIFIKVSIAVLIIISAIFIFSNNINVQSDDFVRLQEFQENVTQTEIKIINTSLRIDNLENLNKENSEKIDSLENKINRLEKRVLELENAEPVLITSEKVASTIKTPEVKKEIKEVIHEGDYLKWFEDRGCERLINDSNCLHKESDTRFQWNKDASLVYYWKDWEKRGKPIGIEYNSVNIGGDNLEKNYNEIINR